MKTTSRLLALLLLTGLFTGLPAADRFDRTKAHIDALLSHRLKPEALPAKPANPFLFSAPGSTLIATPGGIGPVTPVIPEPTANTLADDDQILAFCVSRLRITGQVQRGGRTLLLINSNAYSESDLVPVRSSADVVYYVKIVRIAPGEVVFGYNEVVLSLPLKT
jgi:hypothetical protein